MITSSQGIHATGRASTEDTRPVARHGARAPGEAQMNRLLTTGLVVLAAGCAALGDQAPNKPPGPATRPATTRLALAHIKIDFAKRRVLVDAEVCLREGPLELVLCAWNTKEHESILRTKAKPSQVHFALVALGLTPGKPARWIPGLAGEEGRLLPPRGAQLKISLRWKGAGGKKVHVVDASQWLAPVGKADAERPTRWIFVGSDILPGSGYWADAQGDLICVANFPSAVIDVPFTSSSKAALLDFQANTKAIPKIGTRVEVILQVLPGGKRADHARVVLEIDRFGRCRIGGRPIAVSKLTPWATGYLKRHPKGEVVIRADARSLAWDTERAREELLFGGLRDVMEERLPLRGQLMPRTRAQRQRSLTEWAESFANAQDLLTDPAEDAEALLRQIQSQLRELDQLRVLWTDYAAKLRSMAAKYRASTQPAGPPAKKPE